MSPRGRKGALLADVEGARLRVDEDVIPACIKPTSTPNKRPFRKASSSRNAAQSVSISQVLVFVAQKAAAARHEEAIVPSRRTSAG
jgi:hypothetical protein